MGLEYTEEPMARITQIVNCKVRRSLFLRGLCRLSGEVCVRNMVRLAGAKGVGRPISHTRPHRS
jgi:hypothetical protein